MVESILGERSRTIARIKRENFHRGVSCIEPLDAKQRSSVSLESSKDRSPASALESNVKDTGARGVSWEDTKIKKTKEEGKVKPNQQVAVGKKSDSEAAASRDAENEKLREIISIRRGSSASSQMDQRQMSAGPLRKQVSRTKSVDKEAAQPPLVRGSSKVKDDPRPRPLLQRGSSCISQQALKTSERPPLTRGFSCQPRRNFPSITITRPHSTIEDGFQHQQQQPKIDILEAVSEIHDNFKDNSRAFEEDFTEEETEDEFHEQIQGDAPRPAPN